jgi:hypothetical protein
VPRGGTVAFLVGGLLASLLVPLLHLIVADIGKTLRQIWQQ